MKEHKLFEKVHRIIVIQTPVIKKFQNLAGMLVISKGTFLKIRNIFGISLQEIQNMKLILMCENDLSFFLIGIYF